jgi:hypothetical protein
MFTLYRMSMTSPCKCPNCDILVVKTVNLNESTVLTSVNVGNDHEGHVKKVTRATYRVLYTRLLHFRQNAEPALHSCLVSFCPSCVRQQTQKEYYIYRRPRRNVPDFGRMFLMLKCTHITQNTYIQS